MARRATFCLLVLLVAGAQAASFGEALQKNVKITIDSVTETMQKLADEVQQNYKEAVHEYAAAHPKGAVAAALGMNGGGKRRLNTVDPISSVHDFLGNILGGNWSHFLPSSWASNAFDWAKLGEFDYNSNMADFMSAHDLSNLTDIKSVKDLTAAAAAVEAAFCEPEAFKPSKVVPASCTGPEVTIALTPKVCTIDSASKQIICEPSKLVLTKTPGSCTHKYHSASKWTAKECKIAGTCGFASGSVVGGDEKIIPLTQIDLSYQP